MMSRGRAWRRSETRRVWKNRIKKHNQLFPYWQYTWDEQHGAGRQSRMMGGFRKRRFGCGCGCCKPWKHWRGRSEWHLMKVSDKKRFDSSCDFE